MLTPFVMRAPPPFMWAGVQNAGIVEGSGITGRVLFRQLLSGADLAGDEVGGRLQGAGRDLGLRRIK
jgi:hypothetical protein